MRRGDWPRQWSGVREQLSAVKNSDQGSERHSATVAALPPQASDPFDRILIAQAMSEPLHFVTTDERLRQYGELVVLV